jgi:hypothetical protein
MKERTIFIVVAHADINTTQTNQKSYSILPPTIGYNAERRAAVVVFCAGDTLSFLRKYSMSSVVLI